MYKQISECILCHGTKLDSAVDLQEQFVVDFVSKQDEKLLKAPLELVKCYDCNLLQMKYRVSQDRLYKKFWYRSNINEQMRNELLAIVQNAQSVVEVKHGDKVLDIGCNDGTLLGWYDKNVTTIGIDPCGDLVAEGLDAKRIDIGISDFFSKESVHSIYNSMGIKTDLTFKIITAVAMFYDVPQPVQFLQDCKALLDREGVLIIQMNHVMAMIQDKAFDFICHEHIALYSVSTLQKAVELAGLELAGLELSKSNGGSIRAYITHKGFDKFAINHHQNKLWMATNVDMKLMDEMKLKLDNLETYQKFATNIEFQMARLKHCLLDLVDKGYKIYAAGASTRGTVLTQYLFRDGGSELIQGVADRDEHKYGLKMVGTWWNIMPEDLVRSKATHLLVLPWHFRESITKREKDFIDQGGTLIFPLPSPQVITKSSQAELMTHTEAL